MQTQQAAGHFAAERDEITGPEHLLLAVIDQGDPEALEALDRARLDRATVRRVALAVLNSPDDLPHISMPALTPAGTAGRPPLSVGELNKEAWSALCWRQEHLPLDKVKRLGDRDSLRQLESRAAMRISSKLNLDDDQRYSLLSHHSHRVEQRTAPAKSEVTAPQSRASTPVPRILMTVSGRRRPHLPGWLRFTVGWGVWFGNRRIELGNQWFHLRALGYFRHAAQV
jgi:hypothetical protein